jgi:hypothetical protein
VAEFEARAARRADDAGAQQRVPCLEGSKRASEKVVDSWPGEPDEHDQIERTQAACREYRALGRGKITARPWLPS